MENFYLKVKTNLNFYWMELTGVKTKADAQRIADKTENLGEIGVLDKRNGIKLMSKKNKEGKWE